jgi:beta-glucosidase
MKTTLRLFAFIAFVSVTFWGCQTQDEKSSSAPSKYDKQIRELMAKMTLEEKIGQMNQLTGDWAVTGPFIRADFKEMIKAGNVGSMLNCYTVDYTRELMQLAVDSSRLGIPLLFGYDVIHGHRTIFPIPLAESCSWDLELMEKTARIAAVEASAEGIHWTFAPMVDISREPRWGRVMEGAGEDTWLGSLIAKAKVNGYQGDDLAKNNTILACVKHVAAYGAPEGGRDYNTVDLSIRSLYETYLPPYHAAVEAGVGSAMTAFNEINGIPCTANEWLWEDLMREEWGFQGFVVTDYTAINEMVEHGVAADFYEAAALAANAGVDMDMVGQAFLLNLKKAVEKGEVPEEQINKAVYRILDAKYELGLFDDPYRYCNKEREQNEIMTSEQLAFAQEVAEKSMVLLKNENNLLPLSKEIKTIAVIGPLADNKFDMIGGWSAGGDRYTKPVTLLEGVKNELGENVKVLYAQGTDFDSQSTDGFSEAIRIARKADVVLLALGESNFMSAEAKSRSMINLPGNQNQLADAIIKANKNTVVVLMNGRPLTIQHLDEVAPAILETWFAGTQAGNAIANVIFGDYNPSGKLTMTFPRNVGQIPIYYNHKNTGRPYDPNDPYTSFYIDAENTPLYPFGYGLSYTTFSYSDLKLDKNEISSGQQVNVSVTVTNTGNYAGEEVIQLYIRDLVGSVTRPVKELKGFQKIFLEKGASTTVNFSINEEALSFYRKDMSYGTEPGEFDVFVGGSSATENLVRFTLK